MIMSLIYRKNTTHFHIHGFALVLKPRQVTTQKWAIDGFHLVQHFVAVSRMLLMGCKVWSVGLKMFRTTSFCIVLKSREMLFEEFKINNISTCFNV